MKPKPDILAFELASDLGLVHSAIQDVERFVQQLGCCDPSSVSLVLRELLSNAITHGNRGIRERKVQCRVELHREQFKVVVEDEGEGFDFSRLNLSLPEDPRGIQNRGYVLISNICSAVKFNECGNRVTAVIEKQPEHHNEEGGV